MAMNHWKLAIDTHNSNFPDADHDCADISASDPRRYPSTDILISSPECTHHSQARSKKHKPDLFNPEGDPAAERSRATMWDVPRFAEHHRYEVVVVENVVEIMGWEPIDAWFLAMEKLGYRSKVLSVNSFIAHPTPQSRDRWYTVFWKDGNKEPELEFRPVAWCPSCDENVEAVQSWKRQRRWGKYRQQYLYRCSRCANVALPYAWPAASAIDWSLEGQRIGDRTRPLADATLRRIRVGLDRYGVALIQKSGHTFERPNSGYARAWPLTQPMPTQTTEIHHALVRPPFLAPLRSGRPRVIEVDEPLATVVADGSNHALIVPVHHGTDGPGARPVDWPWPTQTARRELALVVELRGGGSDARRVEEPLATVCASGNHHALIVKNFGDGRDPSMVKSVSDPLGTVTTVDHHALLGLPFTVDYHGNGKPHPVSDPLPTQDTRDRHAVVNPAIEVDDCTFRMLEPHEIGRAMAFPDEYIVLGNKRERVRQYGNAVTPPVMEQILQRCVESLA